MNHLKQTLLYSMLLIVLFSCVNKDDEQDYLQKQLNQEQFLKNSSHIINQSYTDAHASAQLLHDKGTALIQWNGQTSSLSAVVPELKSRLKDAWMAWQKINFYEFGDAAQAALKSNVNIYKTDTAKIEASIRSGQFDLDQLGMKAAKGFPALDYMLNHQTEAELVSALANDSNRRKFIHALTNDLFSRLNAVVQSWSANRGSFETKTGTDVGSSTGMLVNALNQHYEKYFRDNKIGIPLGVRSSGIQRLDFVESAYGQYSVDLAVENFMAMKRFYLGYDQAINDGYGLEEYLIDLNASDLDQRIKNQMNVIDMKLKGLSNPLADQITTDAANVQEVYNEIQKLIILWKVDMPSIMGILITFQDNDGD